MVPLPACCACELQKAAFFSLARTCGALVELDVSNSDVVTDDMVNAIAAALPKLSGLNLCGCSRITDAGVSILTKKLQHLDQLRLDDNAFVSDASLLQLMKSRGARLKTLWLRRCHNVSDATVKELFASLPRALEDLSLGDCDEVTDDAMEFLVSVPSYYGTKRVSTYTALSKLDISGCSRLTALSFAWIAAALPLLTHLSVARCASMSDKSVRSLSSLERLQVLDVSCCPRISDVGMAAFFKPETASSAGVNTQRRPLQTLVFKHCDSIGEKTVDALADTCCGSLSSLDLRFIASIPAPVLTKLVRSCRLLTCLLLSGQAGVTRAVLANLASSNKVLRVLDLSECDAVDDLALYPLLVMNSIQDLRLSGCTEATRRGLRSLPRNLVRLEMRELPAQSLDDQGCREIAQHLRHLETLDVSRCSGVTTPALAYLLEKCAFLHQLNVYDCGSFIQPAQLSPLLDAKRREVYSCEVVVDEDAKFIGIASVDPEASIRARRREVMAMQIARRHHAATWIQTRYRLTRQQRTKRRKQRAQDWDGFCAAIDIQRVFRGYQCRKVYGKIQREVTRAVVFLQYKWRRKRHERRVRRAVGYWTNRLVLKSFTIWKRSHEDLRAEQEHAKKGAKASRALHFWGAKTLPRVFTAWRALAHTNRQNAKKALGFWKCQSLPRVFSAWQGLVAASRLRRARLTVVFLNTVSVEALNSSAQLVQVVSAIAVEADNTLI